MEESVKYVICMCFLIYAPHRELICCSGSTAPRSHNYRSAWQILGWSLLVDLSLIFLEKNAKYYSIACLAMRKRISIDDRMTSWTLSLTWLDIFLGSHGQLSCATHHPPGPPNCGSPWRRRPPRGSWRMPRIPLLLPAHCPCGLPWTLGVLGHRLPAHVHQHQNEVVHLGPLSQAGSLPSSWATRSGTGIALHPMVDDLGGQLRLLGTPAPRVGLQGHGAQWVLERHLPCLDGVVASSRYHDSPT